MLQWGGGARSAQFYVFMSLKGTGARSARAWPKPTSLVSDIPDGDGKNDNLFLQCIASVL